MSPRKYRVTLGAVLALGAAVRVLYAMAQPAHDPAWNRPFLDGAYYVDWARALAAGGSGPGGAFYLAPLYPYVLARFFTLFGENLALLFLVQHAAVLAVAALLASASRRVAGDAAALGSATLLLLVQPPMFFASKPVGETLGLLLLVGAVWLALRHRPGAASGAGVLAGLASLARPNLLLVPAAWAGAWALARRWRLAGLLAAGAVAVIVPVAARNALVSGHWVPISSNAGITLYHGNGPGATGGFTAPPGFSGRLDTQREEATVLARTRSGQSTLDPVEADGWWGRQALRARLADPAGSMRLAAWRLLLLFDGYEHGLDYAPAMDPNPWRRGAPLSFGVIVALAGAAVVLLGPRRTGGSNVWGAIAACAAPPLVFYAASRYRLSLEVLLCLPAGIGAAELVTLARRGARARRSALAVAVGAALFGLSIAVPSGDLARSEEAGALANLAVSHKQAGDLDAAERVARAAIARDGSCVAAWYNLGFILQAQGKREAAEAAYRDVLRRDGGHAAAAGNLSNLLIDGGQAAEAVTLLRRAIGAGAGTDVCWNNLVVALALAGDSEGARNAFAEASRRGVTLDPGLLRAVGGAGS